MTKSHTKILIFIILDISQWIYHHQMLIMWIFIVYIFFILFLDNVDGYIGEKNGDRYSIFASTDQSEELLANIQTFGMSLKI